MTRETLVRTCQVCGKPRWQKHAEVCTGPPPPGSHAALFNPDKPPCNCPPGWKHEPTCPEVTGNADA